MFLLLYHVRGAHPQVRVRTISVTLCTCFYENMILNENPMLIRQFSYFLVHFRTDGYHRISHIDAHLHIFNLMPFVLLE